MSGAGRAKVLRALVVDDEEHLARLVADYLAREGFTVQVALDGEHAVELARAARPDVVVLDLMLPGIDGVEVCRQLRTFTDAYVIMLTARAGSPGWSSTCSRCCRHGRGWPSAAGSSWSGCGARTGSAMSTSWTCTSCGCAASSETTPPIPGLS